jgi:RHS repeat-associated protein
MQENIMTNILTKARMSAHSRRPTFIVILVLVFLINQASAQDGWKNTAGTASGASVGSYGLSDFDSVNLFNGSLSFRLPLMQISGRGGAQIPLTLAIENHWRVIRGGENPDGTQDIGIVNAPWYRASSLLTDYRPGHMRGGHSGWVASYDPPYPCDDPGPGRAAQTLTTFAFITPDGTTHGFTSKVNNGNAADVTGDCTETGFNRGREFITRDGSSMIFIANQDVHDFYQAGNYNFTAAGVLMLRDGTRYTINDKGAVTAIRDRNGNQITFTYTTYEATDVTGGTTEERLTGITDSLNRAITIKYDQQDGGVYGLCDRITFSGFGGATRIIRVSFKELGSLLRADQTQSVIAYPKIAAVWLPDGKSYKFRYNTDGELTRVEFPMGGAYEYDYAAGINNSNVFGTIGDPPQAVYRRVVAKRIYANSGDVTPQSITTFSRPETPGSNPDAPFSTNNLGYVDVDHFDPNKPQGSNLLSRIRHYFYGSAALSMIGSGVWKEGKEYKTEFYGTSNGSTVTLLRRVEHTWDQRPRIESVPVLPEYALENNSHIVETVTTLMGITPNLVSKETYLYDVLDDNLNNDFNNLLEIKEYDYGSGSPGALLRRTVTVYLTVNNSKNYTENDVRLLSLPKEVKVYDGNNVLQSETDYEYDRYTADVDGKHANLTLCPSISGHAAAFHGTYKYRGNVTATTRWILSPRKSITHYLHYDIAGNVVVTLDPLGNRTEFSYADRFGSPNGNVQNDSALAPVALSGQMSYAFPTALTNAMEQTAYTKYDFYTGKSVDVEDVNGAVTSFYYSRPHDPQALATQIDELDRLAQVIHRDSRSANPSNQTTHTYQDAQHLVRTTHDLTAYKDNKLKGETIYDGLGRTIETRTYESSSAYIKVEQKYDAMGRLSETTNPYRPATETPRDTITVYDSLGRVIEVATPDGSKVKTKYVGNVITVTNPMLRVQQSTTDALGRIIEVVEDPGSTTGKLNYVTRYGYDALDNLLTVNQGTTATGLQTRTFEYDSLSRLTSATNPEIGEITSTNPEAAKIKYEYYDNGNLKWKIDPRTISPTSTIRVRTTYQYDGLSRIISKTYNDNITPNVSYYYDRQLPPNAPTGFNSGESIGRLIAVTYGTGGKGTYYSYNKRGEVLQSIQATIATGTTLGYYTSEYSYNASGHLVSQSYPSGRTVKTNYDAAGRIFNITGQRPADLRPTAYASLFGYAAHGAVSKLKLGNGLWEHTTYDPERLQPKEIGLGLSERESSALKLEYKYGKVVSGVPDKTKNDGNVQSQAITVAQLRSPTTNAIISPQLSLSQSYTYDTVNRLISAEEKSGASQVWKQIYTYKDADGKGDQFGNRRIAAGTTSNLMPDAQFNPNISSVNNRIINDQYDYDAAGNLTKAPFIGGNQTYSYDAENRQIKLNGGAALYTYDGEGRRVKKVLVNEMGTAFTTIYVYNAASQLIAEYAPYTQSSDEKVRYLTRDYLGTVRVITDGSAVVKIQADIFKVVKARFDYLPFGEEIAPTIGNRSLVQGYSTTDRTRQKFTGKERDDESGLDYFGARYYSSIQGRFTSPDKPLIDQHQRDPQSWNLFVYVRNNPLRFIDPTGNNMSSADPNYMRTQDQDDQREDQEREKKKKKQQPIEKVTTTDPPPDVEGNTLKVIGYETKTYNGEPVKDSQGNIKMSEDGKPLDNVYGYDVTAIYKINYSEGADKGIKPIASEHVETTVNGSKRDDYKSSQPVGRDDTFADRLGVYDTVPFGEGAVIVHKQTITVTATFINPDESTYEGVIAVRENRITIDTTTRTVKIEDVTKY